MRHCYILRVFTRDGEGGNHLGVITDVTGLHPDEMQSTATELGFSETVYLDWREGPNPVARIFTPARELPFAGHPLVGAAWVMSAMGPGGPSCLTCEVGDVGYRMDGDIVWIDPPGDQPVSEETLDLGEWAEPVDAWTVLMPLRYYVAQLASPEAVRGVRAESVPVDGELYVWAWDEPGRKVTARFFAPGVGVNEDPATGSAAVALAAVRRQAGDEHGEIEIEQGDEMGRPSTLFLRWAPGKVSVGGRVAKDEVRVLDV